MNFTFRLKAVSFAGLGMLSLGSPFACATEGSDDITAVASKVSRDYIRAKLSDGTFQPEYYSFGAGGNWGGVIKDLTIDKLRFLDVAHFIAVPLAKQKYFPAKNPSNTKLIIMIYWGTTKVPQRANESQAYIRAQLTGDYSLALLETKQREQIDALNASILGYPDAQGASSSQAGTALEHRHDSELSELEQERYFVVLMAYDFQLLAKEKIHKLLWETRFSLRQQHHEFDKDLPAMAQFASQYFGQDSNGLVHEAIPMGRVEIGDVKSLGEVPAK